MELVILGIAGVIVGIALAFYEGYSSGKKSKEAETINNVLYNITKAKDIQSMTKQEKLDAEDKYER